MRRVLKSTGSLYLHCDPTAGHYLKILLDAVFMPKNFGNELIWKRQNAKGLAFTRFAHNHDIIFRYTKSDNWIWNAPYTKHDPEYVRKFYKFTDKDGRVYCLDNLTNPNKNRPNLTYEFLGVTRVWRWTQKRMQEAYENGLVVQTKPNAVPRLKRYLDEQEGTPIDDVWTDIPPIHGSSQERLGYPTQKPLGILKRMIQASSNPGDIVLDCFAGAGTTLSVAEKLSRRWVGIDSGVLAAHTIEKRLLSIASSKSLDNPKKKYAVACRPFDILAALEHDEDGCGAHGSAPSVKCRYDIDEETGECVVKIERFSSPGSGLKGMETLSSVAIDLCFDGEAMKIDLFATREELEARGYELRFPLEAIKGEVLLVFADIFGHEKWFVGELA